MNMKWALFRGPQPHPPLWQDCKVLCPWAFFHETIVLLSTTRSLHRANFLLYPSHLPSCLCRCAKEWKLAVHLTKDCRQCHLVAAAAASCSRPEELKPFLYLDFMDQRKHHTVWDMLMQTVGELGLQGWTRSSIRQSDYTDKKQYQTVRLH